MSRIYFAGPLFCAAEKKFNEELCDILTEAGYDVFLPQRDGILAAEMAGKTENELVRMVFEKDTGEIAKSDILVFVTDGRVPDEGACVELGIAYASGKRCYGVRTDARSLESTLPLNPLIAGCFRKIFAADTGETLCASLRAYLAEHEL